METKKKIIHGNDVIELSFEEVFHKYERLLHQKIHSWSKTYDYDDLFQTVSIGLWKAFRDYDLNHNNTPFLGMATTYIENEIRSFHNKYKSKYDRHTSQIKEVMSLNRHLDGKDELVNFIKANDSVSQEVITRLTLNEMLEKLPKHKLEIFTAYLDGFSQKEIAVERNLPCSTVWFHLNSIFKKCRETVVVNG